MGKRHVYRVGDQIRIVTPKFVERVGYPKHWRDLLPEWVAHPKLSEAMALLGLAEPNKHGYVEPPSRILKDFAAGCAMAANRRDGFGGKERALHYYEHQADYTAGQIFEILTKRVVRTGTYYPPSGGRYWTDCGYEYEYQPGGLDGAKSHVLLGTAYGEIEACNVEAA